MRDPTNFFWRKTSFFFVLFLFTFPSGHLACAGPEKGKALHIHMISGAREYKSTNSLSDWKQLIESRYEVHCTISKGHDKTRKIDGLHHLKRADLLVLFNRRFQLKEKYWKPISNYLTSDRPVLGIRTASHAFDRNFPKIDVKLLGADYYGHGKNEEVRVFPEKGTADHPVLQGITDWKRRGKLYKNKNFSDSTIVLLRGKGKNLNEPVAWVNEDGNQRIFYTSMGLPSDFQNEQFLRLLRNAVEWTTRHKLEKRQ